MDALRACRLVKLRRCSEDGTRRCSGDRPRTLEGKARDAEEQKQTRGRLRDGRPRAAGGKDEQDGRDGQDEADDSLHFILFPSSLFIIYHANCLEEK